MTETIPNDDNNIISKLITNENVADSPENINKRCY